MNDLQEVLSIDVDNLDQELLEQALLFAEYGELLVEAEFKKDTAKERLEAVMAELDLEIRGNPEIFNIKKITESVVESTIKKQEIYKKASDNYLLAKKRHKTCKIALEALEHKKDMLESLLKLYLSNYYGNQGDLGLVVNMQKKELTKKKNNTKIKEKMNKGKIMEEE